MAEENPPVENDQDAHVKAWREQQQQQEESDEPSTIKDASPEELERLNAEADEWRERKERDAANARRDKAAAEDSIAEASLSEEESRQVTSFGGAGSEWSQSISKKVTAKKQKLSPPGKPEFSALQDDLDSLVGEGKASYFRKSDQESYIGRIEKRSKKKGITDSQREEIKEERERAGASLLAMDFFGGLSPKAQASKKKQTEAFSMSLVPESAKKQYEEEKKNQMAILNVTLPKIGPDWGTHWEDDKSTTGRLPMGGFGKRWAGTTTTRTKQTKEEAKRHAEYIQPRKEPSTSELDAIVSAGAANYFRPEDRDGYKDRKNARIADLAGQIKTIEQNQRASGVKKSKKAMVEEKAELAEEKRRLTQDVTMAALVDAVISQIKTDTSKKGVTKSQHEEIARTAVTKAYTGKLLSTQKANLPKYMDGRAGGILDDATGMFSRHPELITSEKGKAGFEVLEKRMAAKTQPPMSEPDLAAAAGHVSGIGTKTYKSTSEEYGQVYGPGGKSAPKFSPFGGGSSDPETEKRYRRESIDETFANLVRAANAGDVKEYKMYKDSYTEQLEKEKGDKTYLKSRPPLPKIVVKVGNKKPQLTPEEERVAAMKKGEREAMLTRAQKEGRESKEIEMGVRIPLYSGGVASGTILKTDLLRKIKSWGTGQAEKTKKEWEASSAEESRLQRLGVAAPWLGGLSFGKAVAMESDVEAILGDKKTTRKGGNVPVPVYTPTGEIVGVQSAAEREDVVKLLNKRIQARDELIAKATKKHETVVARKKKVRAEELETYFKLTERAEATMAKADKEESEEREKQTVKRLESKLKDAFRADAFREEKKASASARRKEYAEKTPFGRLVLDQVLFPRPQMEPRKKGESDVDYATRQSANTQKRQKALVDPNAPWNRNIGADGKPLPPQKPMGLFAEAWEELDRGRKARANPRGGQQAGFLYGGGLQPVVTRMKGGGTYEHFPRTAGAPRSIPNPLAHSELMHFGRPFGMVKPIRTKNRRTARKAVTAARRKEARRMARGGGSFLERMFW